MNIKFCKDSNVMIKEYSKIWIIFSPRVGAFDRIYYDAADNRAWICRTSEILIKSYEKH